MNYVQNRLIVGELKMSYYLSENILKAFEKHLPNVYQVGHKAWYDKSQHRRVQCYSNATNM